MNDFSVTITFGVFWLLSLIKSWFSWVVTSTSGNWSSGVCHLSLYRLFIFRKHFYFSSSSNKFRSNSTCQYSHLRVISKAETIQVPSVVLMYDCTAIRRNFDFLHFFQPITEQHTVCDVIGWKSVEGQEFVVLAYADTSVLRKELRRSWPIERYLYISVIPNSKA